MDPKQTRKKWTTKIFSLYVYQNRQTDDTFYTRIRERAAARGKARRSGQPCPTSSMSLVSRLFFYVWLLPSISSSGRRYAIMKTGLTHNSLLSLTGCFAYSKVAGHPWYVFLLYRAGGSSFSCLDQNLISPLTVIMTHSPFHRWPCVIYNRLEVSIPAFTSI